MEKRKSNMPIVFFALGLAILFSGNGMADEVAIVDAQASQAQNGSYRFSVTLRHADNGWDHYADRWDVLGPDGTVLGERILLHPHVAEQPFTRSLSGVQVPPGLKTVSIRAHDKQHGDSPKLFLVDLPGR